MTGITRRNFLRRASLGAAAAAFPFGRASFALAGNLQHKLAHDPRRPQYHLLPAANWMNDPNGPIFYKGRYHMFFQYNPNGAFWGSMHWAHATSPDMVHWKHEPVAIAPTAGGFDRDGVFSGSAVLDGETPTVIYTGVLPAGATGEVTLDDGQHKWREVQCLATSRDPALRTWQKLPEPIIAHPPNLAITGFRDPGVWREGKEWLLTLGSGIKGKGGAVLLYESRDLRHWTYRHPLIEGQGTGRPAANAVDNGEMWECPDFFPLGDRHVLLYATMGKVLWKTGRYRERRFHAEQEGVVDYGAYYAAKTMVDAGGNRILWGWIPETRPEAEYRAAGWAGLMALPRTLSLGSDGSLETSVAPVVERLRTDHRRVGDSEDRQDKQKALAAIRIRELAGELRAEFEAQRAFQLRLRSEKGELYAEIVFDPRRTDAELRVNATTGSFRSEGPVSLRVFLDGSALEVFAKNRAAITARVYKVPPAPLLVEVSEVDALRSLDVWEMTPISKDRLTT
jgi:beta-fructofuranosidase